MHIKSSATILCIIISESHIFKLIQLNIIPSIEFHRKGTVKAVKGLIKADFTISLSEFNEAVKGYTLMKQKVGGSVQCGTDCDAKLKQIDDEMMKIEVTFAKIEAAVMKKPRKLTRLRRSMRIYWKQTRMQWLADSMN